MYKNVKTLVRTSVGETNEFSVNVGLHQGSALSPYLFDLVVDAATSDIKSESPWSILFADDIVLCSSRQEDLQRKLEQWREALENRGFKINRKKTVYLSTGRENVTSIKMND